MGFKQGGLGLYGWDSVFGSGNYAKAEITKMGKRLCSSRRLVWAAKGVWHQVWMRVKANT
jgi:hypothetical protein